MSKEFQLNIISPEKNLFSGVVTSVIVPGLMGKFGVYGNHAPMISPMKKGQIVYTAAGTEETIETGGGVVEVNNNVVTICIE